MSNMINLNTNEEQATRHSNLFNSIEGAEDISRREKHAKHFDLGCGRYQAVMYSDQVHFADENGTMQEIDNNLESTVANGRSILRNRANPMKVEFPAQTDDGDLVKITHNGKPLSWRMENELPAAKPTIRTGAALKREMLVKHANHMKGKLNQKLAAANEGVVTASLAAEPVSMVVKATPAALKEFISPDIDADAVSTLMAAKDVAALSDEQLEKAVFSPADRRADITHRAAEISYSGLRPGVSARYRMEGMRMKEDIVVESAESLDEVAVLLCPDFNYVVDDQQGIEVRDKQTGEVCFSFNPPLVYDAAGHQEIATVSLETRASDVRMTYGLSEAFLASAVYPVTIDPVVQTSHKSSAVYDGYIWKDDPSDAHSSPHLLRCGQGEGGESIALIKFKKLIKQRASDTIIGAWMNLYAINYGGDAEFFAIHPYLGDDIIGATWNTVKPLNEEQTKIGTDIIAYITETQLSKDVIPSGYAVPANSFDITNLCRSWYQKDASGVSQNKGIAVRYIGDCGTSDKYVEWYSTTGNTSYCPRLVINYVSHAGLESWWQYEQMSAGRAGTAYVDIFNGNLIYEHADTATTGNLMPVSVKHFYNSCLSESNPVSCGMGWRTSMHQSMRRKDINNVNYFIWTDGDGTEHYFPKTGESPYEDAEGMQLKLEADSNPGNGKTAYIRITDKDNNVMHFPYIYPSGTATRYITKITNPMSSDPEVNADLTRANLINFSYDGDDDTTGKISTITDGAGRVTSFAYSNDLLKRITAPNGLFVDYTYDTYDETLKDGSIKTHHRLTGITYSDLLENNVRAAAKNDVNWVPNVIHTSLTYMENPDNINNSKTNMLTSFTNFDGQKVAVSYQTNYDTESVEVTDYAMQCLKVKSLDLTNGAAKGSKMLIEYLDMVTKITTVDATDENGHDTLGKTLTYQFNDSGNVVCMFDELGYAQFTKFSSGIPNTADKSSKLQKAVVNLVKNIDFLSDWTPFPENDTNTARREVNLSYRCLNMPSVRLVNGTVPEAKWTQNCSVSKDGNYTFSAYVRTDGIENGGAFLRISDGANVKTSRMVSASTATISGGPGADGWDRVFATINVPAYAALTLEMCCTGTTGDALFSCPQLEEGSVPNRVNMLVNGDFGMVSLSAENSTYYFPDYWEKKSGILSAKGSHVIMDRAESNLPAELSGNALSLYSRPNRDSVAFGQIIYNRGAKGDCFTVGGWCNARSVAKIPESSIKNAPCIAYRFYDSDTNPGSWKYLNFSREWVGWQFGCWAITAPEAYTRLEIHVNYARNAQKCMFSNIFVHREQFGKTFAYDDKKNVTSVANLSETKSNMEYDAYDNLTSYTQPGGSDSDKYTMTYGDTTTKKKKHLLETFTTPEKVKQKFEYDGFGNQTSAATVNDLASPTLFIKTRTEYTNGDEVNPLPEGINNNYPYKTYDARGNAVTRTMRTDNYMLASVEDPTGQKVLYDYDDSLRVKEVRAEVPITIESADAEPGSEGENEQETPKDVYYNKYTYDNDRLKTVRHNTDANEANDVIYTFDYDGLGRKTTVKVGNQVLSTNVYSDADNSNDRRSLLEKVQYGNGGEVSYIYDDFDRIKAIRYDEADKDRYTYEYGANGQAALLKDHNLNRVHRTEYDLAERPCQATIREMNEDESEGDLIYRTTLTYDKKNRLQDFAESLPEESHKTSYTYDKDNRTTVIQYDDADHKVVYAYDTLGRVFKRTVENGSDAGKLETVYTFVAGGYGTNSTTPLVASIAQKGISFAYTYDSRGNIASETRTDASGNSLTTTYVYDALGQLVRVNDPHDTTASAFGTTWVFSYDRGGNITGKVRYAYTTGTLGTVQETIPYAYNDSNWKDKLTAYNDRTFTYDAIGNPTSDGIWSYEWEVGRRLKSMYSEGAALTFKYNHDGLRTQKVVQQDWYPVTTNYTLHGKLITHMAVDYTDWNEVAQQDVLHFFYDDQSRPAKVSFNGTIYTYIYNLQGDIVGLLDSAGNLVVEYKYDAWGKLLSTTGTMANTLGKRNPFRYRGYVYDEESGLYYLRSRYYNPEWSRFVNADACMGWSSLMGKNLYMYCSNGPIVFSDSNGFSPEVTPSPSRPENWDTAFYARMLRQKIKATITRVAKTIVNKVKSVYNTVKKAVKNAVLVAKASQLAQHGGGVIKFNTGLKATCYTSEYWYRTNRPASSWGSFAFDAGLTASGAAAGKISALSRISPYLEVIGIGMLAIDACINLQVDQINRCIDSSGSIGWISWERSVNAAPMPTAWDSTTFTPGEWFGEIESVEFFE